jgi:pilus assembly protein CpaF
LLNFRGRISDRDEAGGPLSSARPLNIANDWKQQAGPLRRLFADESISEIMVNSWDSIYVERNGVIEPCDVTFQNPEALHRFVQSLSAFLGFELNRKTPYLDARLPDGSRLNIVIPPVTLESASITIRKATVTNFNYQTLIKAGTVDEKLMYFLKESVSNRQNILISGGTGSGKTTILGVLTSFIGATERVVAIEDTAEMKVNVRNLVRMESGTHVPGEDPILTEDLLRNALRMRPDRILIGECRGPEAFDMLMAMNTGHDGSMTTIHANSALDALRRLEAMILRSGIGAPMAMVQQDIASTINLVVQATRTFDGKRRVVEVLEVLGRDENGYQTETVFSYVEPMGQLSTGYIPRFARNPSAKFPHRFFEADFTVKLSK